MTLYRGEDVEIEDRIQRAARWHGGLLSEPGLPSSFDMHVAGPLIHGDVDRPTRFHTYACLYPDLGVYGVDNLGNWPGLSVTAQEVRQIIAKFSPRGDYVIRQRELARQYMPGTTNLVRWQHACLLATAAQLPVAMMMFGHTVEADQMVVYQRSVVMAPLVKVAKTFREVAPVTTTE